MFLIAKSFLFALILVVKAGSFNWEADWFEVITASDDNADSNVLSFCLLGVDSLDVKFVGIFFGSSSIL